MQLYLQFLSLLVISAAMPADRNEAEINSRLHIKRSLSKANVRPSLEVEEYPHHVLIKREEADPAERNLNLNEDDAAIDPENHHERTNLQTTGKGVRTTKAPKKHHSHEYGPYGENKRPYKLSVSESSWGGQQVVFGSEGQINQIAITNSTWKGEQIVIGNKTKNNEQIEEEGEVLRGGIYISDSEWGGQQVIMGSQGQMNQIAVSNSTWLGNQQIIEGGSEEQSINSDDTESESTPSELIPDHEDELRGFTEEFKRWITAEAEAHPKLDINEAEHAFKKFLDFGYNLGLHESLEDYQSSKSTYLYDILREWKKDELKKGDIKRVYIQEIKKFLDFIHSGARMETPEQTLSNQNLRLSNQENFIQEFKRWVTAVTDAKSQFDQDEANLEFKNFLDFSMKKGFNQNLEDYLSSKSTILNDILKDWEKFLHEMGLFNSKYFDSVQSFLNFIHSGGRMESELFRNYNGPPLTIVERFIRDENAGKMKTFQDIKSEYKSAAQIFTGYLQSRKAKEQTGKPSVPGFVMWYSSVEAKPLQIEYHNGLLESANDDGL